MAARDSNEPALQRLGGGIAWVKGHSGIGLRKTWEAIDEALAWGASYLGWYKDSESVRCGDIPDGADVVAYCRCPYCVYADASVRVLVKKGVAAARLEDGFPEWAGACLPVART